MTVTEKLRAYCAAENISISELSRRINKDRHYVSGPTVTRWYNGKGGVDPSLSQLTGLARATGYPVAYWADDSFDEPGKVGGERALPDAEQEVIKKARLLGVKEAGIILENCVVLGYQKAASRLLAGAAALAGEEGVPQGHQGGGRLGIAADDRAHPEMSHHVVAKPNPRKIGK